MEMDMPFEQPVGRRADAPAARLAVAAAHPEDVLENGALTAAEKREILASWVSDANAVPDRPWLRQLDSGFQVPVREIIEALKSLDSAKGRQAMRTDLRHPSNDDDDLPPSPAGARPTPGCGLAACG